MHFLLLTSNRFGVLSRITSVVSSLAANIETAAVYPLGSSGMSVVHLTVDASEVTTDRLHRRLSRLVDVVEITSGAEAEKRTLRFDWTVAAVAAGGEHGGCP